MKTLSLYKDGVEVIGDVKVLRSTFQRMRGLIGPASLSSGSAVYIPSCGSVHTFFMRFSLDLIFLSESMQVVKIARAVPSWRMVFGGIKSTGIIEMQAGWFSEDILKVGDVVSLG